MVFLFFSDTRKSCVKMQETCCPRRILSVTSLAQVGMWRGYHVLILAGDVAGMGWDWCPGSGSRRGTPPPVN